MDKFFDNSERPIYSPLTTDTMDEHCGGCIHTPVCVLTSENCHCNKFFFYPMVKAHNDYLMRKETASKKKKSWKDLEKGYYKIKHFNHKRIQVVYFNGTNFEGFRSDVFIHDEIEWYKLLEV